MVKEKKWGAPAATDDTPISNHNEGYERIIAPDSTEAQALQAVRKLQEEQDHKAMRKIAKAFTKEEWHDVLSVAPPQILADELAKRATKGESIARRMTQVYEEETKEWN